MSRQSQLSVAEEVTNRRWEPSLILMQTQENTRNYVVMIEKQPEQDTDVHAK